MLRVLPVGRFPHSLTQVWNAIGAVGSHARVPPAIGSAAGCQKDRHRPRRYPRHVRPRDGRFLANSVAESQAKSCP